MEEVEKITKQKETPRKAEEKVQIQENSWEKNIRLQEKRKVFTKLGNGSSLKGNQDWGVRKQRNQLKVFSELMLNLINTAWSIHRYSSLTEK